MARPRSPRSWLVVVFVACAMVGAACSSPGRAERVAPGTDSSATTAPAAPETTAPSSATTRTDGPTRVEALRLGVAGAAAVDPLAASPASVTDILVLDLVYDGLTMLDAAGRAMPGLATFESNDDLTEWTFTLGADATFADGSPVQAEDVSFSLNRILGRADSLAALRLDAIESVSTKGLSQISIVVDRPLSVLPEMLAAPVYAITDRSTMAEYLSGADVVPNGSGEYRVASADTDSLVLERRAGSGPDIVEVVRFPDESAAVDAFIAGAVDWTVAPPDRIGDALAVSGADGLVPFHGGLFLAVDPSIAPLDDLRLRQAIAYAIDRSAVVDEVYGPTAQPLAGIIPAGVPAASESTCLEPCGPDRAKATALAAAVFVDGQRQPLRILVEDTGPLARVGRVLANQIQAVGVDVTVDVLDIATYEALVTSGQQQLFVFGWLGVARSPVEHLATLFQSQSPDNVSRYEDDAVDAAIAAAEAEAVAATRDAAWQSAERTVLDQVAVVPLVQFRTTGVMSPRLQGFVVHADGSVDVSGVTFETADD